MTVQHSIAKLSRPKVSGVILRDRLFHLLDEGIERPVTWISAPAGSGKTTLVASWLDSRKLPCLWYQVDEGDGDLATFFYYMGLAAKKAVPRYKKPLPLLTPEYLQGVPTFTRRYFEELYSRLIGRGKACLAPTILVLDNYQDAPGKAFQEMMANALDVVPDGVRIIVLSRADAPPQLARLQANSKISLIGWEDIKFTLEESGDLVVKQGKEKLSEKEIELLYEKTNGWAAGMVLMMEVFRGGVLQFAPTGHKQIFDYFANVIIDKTDETTRNVLLKTAFLNKIEPAMAEKLTGVDSAGRILEKLSRDHYFTYRHENGYQYHPLFREFLIDLAKSSFSKTDLSVLQQNAAGLLIETGYVEEAIELLKESRSWDRLIVAVQPCTPKLLAEGRYKTVEGWLRAVPEEMLQQMPWALYWLGSCCLPIDQMEARGHFEKAYRLFKDAGDIAGRYLAWAGIADSFIFLWDDFSGMKPWLSELEVLHRDHPQFPSADVEARVILGAFSTLYFMDPKNPMVERWRMRIEELMYELPDLNFKCQAANNMMLYYLWFGTFFDMRRIADYIGKFRDHPEATPFARILVRHAMACPDWMSSESERARTLCEEGLQIAEQSGIHLLDHFLLAYQLYSYGCFHADTAAMKPILDRMRDRVLPHRRLDLTHFNHLMGWYLGLCRRYDEALVHCREAIALVKLSVVSPAAFVYVNTAQNLLLSGRLDEVSDYLAKGEEIAERHGCVLAGYKAGFVRAAFTLQRGDKKAMDREVRKIIGLAIRLGYWSYSIPHPDILQAVCAYALKEGIEADYSATMVRKNRLLPPDDAPENWPYPIKIYTLGKFEIVIDGKPVEFTGKVQKKPLEMLKAIIAFGGRDVSEEQLTDALWPDSEGDAAHSTFRSTLHRLRQLLGNEEALTVKDGKLTLDPRYCRVDAWAFQQMVSAVESSPGNDKEKIQPLIEKGMEIYKGEFLSGDKTMAKIISMRERLNGGFVSLVERLGRIYTEAGEWEKGVHVYKKGIEINDLQEEFYRGLMLCYGKLGRRADVQTTYHRCARLLASVLSVEPSRETKTVYKKVMEG